MMEYRCTCRKCNTFYCFNDKDAKDSKLARNMSRVAMAGSMMDAFDRRPVSSYTSMEDGVMLSSFNRDYSRCPRCGSIDIAVERRELRFA